jgi:hypothetical protein
MQLFIGRLKIFLKNPRFDGIFISILSTNFIYYMLIALHGGGSGKND